MAEVMASGNSVPRAGVRDDTKADGAGHIKSTSQGPGPSVGIVHIFGIRVLHGVCEDACRREVLD